MVAAHCINSDPHHRKTQNANGKSRRFEN